MAGERGLSKGLETSSVSAERNEDWIYQSLVTTVTENFWQKLPSPELGAEAWWRGLHRPRQCEITGTAAPEKWCYRMEVWSLLSAGHHCFRELEEISMEKPWITIRILLMLQRDIFCLILKGKLMLTVKSIPNQDWNLFYDHRQWTPYYWTHKWCHISAVLQLPIFGPEMPILIKNFNLKDEVSLADHEK